MQFQLMTTAMVLLLGSWTTLAIGQDVLDDLFSDTPAAEEAAPADSAPSGDASLDDFFSDTPADDTAPPADDTAPPADDTATGGSPLDDLFSNEPGEDTPEVMDDSPASDSSVDDFLADPPAAPRDATDQAIDDLLSDPPPAAQPPSTTAPVGPRYETPVPDLFKTDETPTPGGRDLFPGDQNGTPNVDTATPMDVTVPNLDGSAGDAMEKPGSERMDAPATPAPSTDAGYVLGLPNRPYYSANGVYDRIILFDRHRFHANPAMPFYAVDGSYTGEVMNNDGHMLHEDHQANPNMWPWSVHYSYPNWNVPFTHREFGGPSGVHGHGMFSVQIDWKSFADHQLNDFRMRKRKANEINGLIAGQPELNKLGNSVDWQEHSWTQMHDVSLRLDYANRLREMGVKVDYRRYSPEQLLNFLSRVRLAQKLDKLNCKVNWRLYSWRQLHDLLLRAEQADDLMSSNQADEAAPALDSDSAAS